MKDNKKQIEAMRKLGMTEEEIAQALEDDATIDKGGKCDWEPELTPEQKKLVRKARMADREVKKEKVKRTRKPDEDKREIINYLAGIIEDLDAIDHLSIDVQNPEREICFTYNGRQFKITLSSPRAPKE